jgi:hypothetical protein
MGMWWSSDLTFRAFSEGPNLLPSPASEASVASVEYGQSQDGQLPLGRPHVTDGTAEPTAAVEGVS